MAFNGRQESSLFMLSSVNDLAMILANLLVGNDEEAGAFFVEFAAFTDLLTLFFGIAAGFTGGGGGG
ncbi:MAG: hypothetical protein LBH04_05585, partial [Tannerellaceae bacterium]|nr:hypothetical protein [Tannerellaceae bacterium]